MAYRDNHGYQREPSNLVHRHRAYHHIYLKNRKKYPLPFEAYEVHHIDGDKNNNRMDNLAVLTPEQHDKAHEILSNYGVSVEDFFSYIVIAEENFKIDKEQLLKDFEELCDEIQREDLEKRYYGDKYGEKTDNYVEKHIEEAMEFVPARYIFIKTWNTLLENYEKEIKEKKEAEEEAKRKKERNEKIKAGIKKGFNKLFGKKEKNLYCIDCNRPINHIGRCLACNMEAKRKIEAQIKMKK